MIVKVIDINDNTITMAAIKVIQEIGDNTISMTPQKEITINVNGDDVVKTERVSFDIRTIKRLEVLA